MFHRLVQSILATLLIVVCVSSCARHEMIIVPDDPCIAYTGRILRTDTAAPVFTYPGTSATVNFDGPSITMQAKPGSGYFMVSIDDNEPFKINFDDKTSMIVLADSLEAGKHRANVVYAIEGYEYLPEFRGFILEKGGKVLPPDPAKKLKIEFIGNSITCGYGSEANDPNIRFSYDTENHTLSYAYLTAKALDAEYNAVCRSGIGIYRNYGGPLEGTEMTMPQQYDNTLLYNDQYKWDHSTFRPDIICINLGTNDTSLDTYDIDKYRDTYAEFVNHLHSVQPQAQIVLLTGSMMSGQALDDVKTALDSIASGRDYAYRFDMSPQTGDLGYGADWHPSAQQHQRMADELTPFLKQLANH